MGSWYVTAIGGVLDRCCMSYSLESGSVVIQNDCHGQSDSLLFEVDEVCDEVHYLHSYGPQNAKEQK